MKTIQTSTPRTAARRTASRSFSIALPQRAPRNPLVVPSLGRKAGAHERSGGASRQAAKRELRTLMTQS